MKFHRTSRLFFGFVMAVVCIAGVVSADDDDQKTHTYQVSSDDGESWTIVCNDGSSIVITGEDGETVLDLDLEIAKVMTELGEGLENLHFDIHFDEDDLLAMSKSLSEMVVEISADLEETLDDLEIDLRLGKHNQLHVICEDNEFKVNLNELMTELGSTLETAFSEFSGDGRRAHRHFNFENDDIDNSSLRQELSELRQEIGELRQELRTRKMDEKD